MRVHVLNGPVGGLRIRGRSQWLRFVKTERASLVSRALGELRKGQTQPQRYSAWSHFGDPQAKADPQGAQATRPPSTPRTATPFHQPSPPGPSAQQWKAVATALEKHFGLAGWPSSGYTFEKTPQFTIVWDRGELLTRPDANGIAVFREDGTVEIGLRSTAAPRDLERTMLHELTHLGDWELIRAGSSEQELEAWAYQRAEALLWWRRDEVQPW